MTAKIYCKHCERPIKLPAKKSPKFGEPGFKMPRVALNHVVVLAVYGGGEGLEKDDVAAVLKVCAAFGIEVPDSPYFPKKKKKRRSVKK